MKWKSLNPIQTPAKKEPPILRSPSVIWTANLDTIIANYTNYLHEMSNFHVMIAHAHYIKEELQTCSSRPIQDNNGSYTSEAIAESRINSQTMTYI